MKARPLALIGARPRAGEAAASHPLPLTGARPGAGKAAAAARRDPAAVAAPSGRPARRCHAHLQSTLQVILFRCGCRRLRGRAAGTRPARPARSATEA